MLLLTTWAHTSLFTAHWSLQSPFCLVALPLLCSAVVILCASNNIHVFVFNLAQSTPDSGLQLRQRPSDEPVSLSYRHSHNYGSHDDHDDVCSCGGMLFTLWPRSCWRGSQRSRGAAVPLGAMSCPQVLSQCNNANNLLIRVACATQSDVMRRMSRHVWQ